MTVDKVWFNELVGKIVDGTFVDTEIVCNRAGLNNDDVSKLMVAIQGNMLLAGALTTLDLSGNDFTQIELPINLYKLENLFLSNNKELVVLNIPVSLTALRILSLSNLSALKNLFIPETIINLRQLIINNSGIENLLVPLTLANLKNIEMANVKLNVTSKVALAALQRQRMKTLNIKNLTAEPIPQLAILNLKDSFPSISLDSLVLLHEIKTAMLTYRSSTPLPMDIINNISAFIIPELMPENITKLTMYKNKMETLSKLFVDDVLSGTVIKEYIKDLEQKLQLAIKVENLDVQPRIKRLAP